MSNEAMDGFIKKSAITAEQFRLKAVREIDIVGFEAGETITVRVKGISMMQLATSGKIPNNLLGTATELFEGKKKAKEGEEQKTNLSDMGALIDVVVASALVEPAFDEVEEFMTDEQKMEIFYFAQGGVESLKSFRQKSQSKQPDSDSTSV